MVSKVTTKIILVVDDNAAIRHLINLSLSTIGWPVILAEDGEEALRLYNSGGFAVALVITDIDMPRLDGPSLIKALMKMSTSLTYMYVSGRQPSGVAAEHIRSRRAVFLAKPFTIDTLRVNVENLIGNSNSSNG